VEAGRGNFLPHDIARIAGPDRRAAARLPSPRSLSGKVYYWTNAPAVMMTSFSWPRTNCIVYQGEPMKRRKSHPYKIAVVVVYND
jgi:hypothetical protein